MANYDFISSPYKYYYFFTRKGRAVSLILWFRLCGMQNV